jgi:cytochrome oxidase Cu insertion factor (SCO1/SenC/PrrC family)
MTALTIRRLRWAALSAAIGLIAVMIAAARHVAETPPPPTGLQSGQADVGGPFTLTTHLGRVVSEADFRGGALVIYFGWTRDPDLTPAALQVLAAALAKLGPKSDAITSVFISLDPEHDKTEILKGFVQNFDPRLLGLSGSIDQIAALTRAYKLYSKRIADASLPGGYSIDHASLYYVMGSDGGFRGVVPHTTDSAALAAEILKLAK